MGTRAHELSSSRISKRTFLSKSSGSIIGKYPLSTSSLNRHVHVLTYLYIHTLIHILAHTHMK